MKIDDENDLGIPGSQLENEYTKNRQLKPETMDVELKTFLPIKTASGKVIKVAQEVKIEPEMSSEEENLPKRENFVKHDEDLISKASTSELFASRAVILERYKRQIASCCDLLIADPQTNVISVKILNFVKFIRFYCIR